MPKCANFPAIKQAFFAAKKAGKSLKHTPLAKEYMNCIKGKKTAKKTMGRSMGSSKGRSKGRTTKRRARK
jgi:hypothetical protein